PNLDHRMGGRRKGYHTARPRPGAIEALPNADVVLLVGTDLTADAPVLDLILKRGLVLKKSMRLIIAHPRKTALNKFASQWLQYTPGEEIALLNALAKAAIEEGVASADLQAADKMGWDALAQGLAGRTVAQLADAAGVPEAEIRTAARM